MNGERLIMDLREALIFDYNRASNFSKDCL